MYLPAKSLPMPPSIQTDMSMFSHSRKLTINGGTFTAVATSPTRIGIGKNLSSVDT